MKKTDKERKKATVRVAEGTGWWKGSRGGYEKVVGDERNENGTKNRKKNEKSHTHRGRRRVVVGKPRVPWQRARGGGKRVGGMRGQVRAGEAEVVANESPWQKARGGGKRVGGTRGQVSWTRW